MVHHFNEQNRRDLGIVWFIIGLVFLVSGFLGGLVFFILGVIWLASTMGDGLDLFQTRPDYMRAMLKNVTLVMLGLAIVILFINAIR